MVLKRSVLPKGICRICGCTERRACSLESGRPCSWADSSRTLCNRQECLVAKNDENGIYPFEIIDLTTGRIVARTSTDDIARQCAMELNEKGYLEID